MVLGSVSPELCVCLVSTLPALSPACFVCMWEGACMYTEAVGQFLGPTLRSADLFTALKLSKLAWPLSPQEAISTRPGLPVQVLESRSRP